MSYQTERANPLTAEEEAQYRNAFDVACKIGLNGVFEIGYMRLGCMLATLDAERARAEKAEADCHERVTSRDNLISKQIAKLDEAEAEVENLRAALQKASGIISELGYESVFGCECHYEIGDSPCWLHDLTEHDYSETRESLATPETRQEATHG